MNSKRNYVDEKDTIKNISKPNLYTLFLEFILNKVFVVAILATIIMYNFTSSVAAILGNNRINAISFFPLFLYLAYMTYTLLIHSFTEYVITDKALYKKTGIIKQTIIIKPFNEISHLTIQRGFIDRMMKTGDIVINNGPYINQKKHYDGDVFDGLVLTDISNFKEVFSYIKNHQSIFISEKKHGK